MLAPNTGLAAYMGVSSDNTLTHTFSVVPPNKRLCRRKNCEKKISTNYSTASCPLLATKPQTLSYIALVIRISASLQGEYEYLKCQQRGTDLGKSHIY